MKQVINGKRNILVVDDDTDILFLLEHKLTGEGFNVQISPNGENIMDIITQSPPFLVLLDIKMKGVDGGTICHLIKFNESTEKIPVIMFSSNENIEAITNKCGADGFITKPFNLDKMKDSFERILGADYMRAS